MLDTTSIVRHPVATASSCKGDSQSGIKTGQTTCKPGSVPAVKRGDGHSSGTLVAERLTRPTRAATRKHRCRLPGVPPLFGLAPGGVCPAASVAGRAVGSYPTVSPLPVRRTGQAVCFLWHFPWGHPRRTLSGTVSPWSPDFPHRTVARAMQPSSRLTRATS